MKALKLLFVLGLLFAAYELASTGLEQFEHFVEVHEASYHFNQWLPKLHVTGVEYNTPFHVVNMVALVLLAVGAVVAAIYVANDEAPSSPGIYLRVVLLTTTGIVGLATTFAEAHLNHEFSNYGLAHPFHEGSGVVLFAVSIILIAFALVYLLTDLDLDGQHDYENEEPEERPCCDYHADAHYCGPHLNHCIPQYPWLYPVVPPYDLTPHVTSRVYIVDLSEDDEPVEDVPEFEAEISGTYDVKEEVLEFNADVRGDYPDGVTVVDPEELFRLLILDDVVNEMAKRANERAEARRHDESEQPH